MGRSVCFCDFLVGGDGDRDLDIDLDRTPNSWCGAF